MAGILAAAIGLAVGMRAGDPYVAVAALSLAFGFQMFAESAYWSATMDIAGPATGAATGLINSVNNLGGVLSTALTPILFARFGWDAAFLSCIAVSVVAALLWLGDAADRPLRSVRRGPQPTAETLRRPPHRLKFDPSVRFA